MREETGGRASFVDQPGKGYAIASLACGIIGLLLLLSGMPFISFILGIVGVAMASVAARSGYIGGMITAGRVLSWISIIIGIVITILFFLMLFGILMFGGVWINHALDAAQTVQTTTQPAMI